MSAISGNSQPFHVSHNPSASLDLEEEKTPEDLQSLSEAQLQTGLDLLIQSGLLTLRKAVIVGTLEKICHYELVRIPKPHEFQYISMITDKVLLGDIVDQIEKIIDGLEQSARESKDAGEIDNLRNFREQYLEKIKEENLGLMRASKVIILYAAVNDFGQAQIHRLRNFVNSLQFKKLGGKEIIDSYIKMREDGTITQDRFIELLRLKEQENPKALGYVEIQSLRSNLGRSGIEDLGLSYLFQSDSAEAEYDL